MTPTFRHPQTSRLDEKLPGSCWRSSRRSPLEVPKEVLQAFWPRPPSPSFIMLLQPSDMAEDHQTTIYGYIWGEKVISVSKNLEPTCPRGACEGAELEERRFLLFSINQNCVCAYSWQFHVQPTMYKHRIYNL